MATEIGVIFAKPNDRLWLPRLREWMRTSGPTFRKVGTKAPVSPFGTPEDALRWRAELPNERLVVAIGFRRGEIDDHEKLALACGEPIIIGDPEAAKVNGFPSASFLRNEPAITCSDVRPQLRKSIIRAELRRQVEIRPPSSDGELAGYFSLRYRVWKAIGFLSDERLSRELF
jgi:hypothetical protein